MYCVVANYRRWSDDVDPRQLGSAREEGFGSDADAGGYGSAKVFAFGIDGVKCGGGAEVYDTRRNAVKGLDGNGVDNAVGTDPTGGS